MAKWLMVALASALVCSTAVQAQVPLPRLDRQVPGVRARVLVLGTVHLGQLPEPVAADALDPLLDRLAAYKPDVITIEAISGQRCEMMRHYPTLYDADSLGHFCSTPDDARVATGLDVPSAVARVQDTLQHWPAKPAPAQRRHLAALFMAAGDRTSALVQWLQLPPSDRHAGEGLDDALVKQLRALAADHDENVLIAARLAARLGLQRVYPVDDHTGDAFPVDDVKAYAAALEGAWGTSRKSTGPVREHEKALIDAGDLLGLYRYINRTGVLRTVIEGDFGAALRDTSPQHYGQLYVAGWETRNLRMVASVREAFVERPGARVLSIVGSEHKPWFDGLLGQMQDVDVMNVEQVLGGPAK
ncbi:MAG TPA: DUF5694 domain-containing protein [Frateuria sp.]|uniref:DUF5694 domain-containing protein n=1 Tax=Frateuria sp. TaxID=2211372 RepID=UPI002D7E9A69|nr:DUF5694 domain-containing protein [Frateuria sp.]HET6805307.1 DUF5694 domain-containing protein [Frateuria sp.]